MRIGDARVSTNEQNLDLQLDDLKKAGVRAKNIFTDKIIGTSSECLGLEQALSHLWQGDTLVIWLSATQSLGLCTVAAQIEVAEPHGVAVMLKPDMAVLSQCSTWLARTTTRAVLKPPLGLSARRAAAPPQRHRGHWARGAGACTRPKSTSAPRATHGDMMLRAQPCQHPFDGNLLPHGSPWRGDVIPVMGGGSVGPRASTGLRAVGWRGVGRAGGDSRCAWGWRPGVEGHAPQETRHEYETYRGDEAP
jgi:hypothetical protein